MIRKFIILSILIALTAIFLSKIPKNGVEFRCTPSDYQCYEDYYSQIVKVKGIKEAFNDLKTRYKTDNIVKETCHPLTHAIGRAASLKFKTPGEAFVYGDNFCSSGYYHGVLEGIAAKMGRDKLLANLNSICNDIQGKSSYSLDYYNCVHGLGHGIMAITDDELFQSLDYCDKLTGDWEQKSCASGVFMENIVIDGINHQTKYLKTDDLLYPCDFSPEKYKGTCYLMQSSYILRVTGFNFPKTFETCAKAEGNHKNECYLSLGRDVSGFTISNVEGTKKLCFMGQSYDQKLDCIIGAVRDFKYYFHNNKEAIKLCNSLTDQAMRKDCLAETTSY